MMDVHSVPDNGIKTKLCMLVDTSIDQLHTKIHVVLASRYQLMHRNAHNRIHNKATMLQQKVYFTITVDKQLTNHSNKSLYNV